MGAGSVRARLLLPFPTGPLLGLPVGVNPAAVPAAPVGLDVGPAIAGLVLPAPFGAALKKLEMVGCDGPELRAQRVPIG